MTGQFASEKRTNLSTVIATQQVRDERVPDAVVLIYWPGLAAHVIGIEDADGVPVVQQDAQFLLRSSCPSRIVLHQLRLGAETSGSAAVGAKHPTMPLSVRSIRPCRMACGRPDVGTSARRVDETTSGTSNPDLGASDQGFEAVACCEPFEQLTPSLLRAARYVGFPIPHASASEPREQVACAAAAAVPLVHTLRVASKCAQTATNAALSCGDHPTLEFSVTAWSCTSSWEVEASSRSAGCD